MALVACKRNKRTNNIKINFFAKPKVLILKLIFLAFFIIILKGLQLDLDLIVVNVGYKIT